MAEEKKGFILYADLIHTIKHLTDEQAGNLFKHVLMYVNDEDPESDNPITKITFEPIKQQLKRDLEKWDTTRGKRSLAGKASAEARRLKKEQATTKSTRVESVQQTSTKSTVSVNDNVNDNVNVKEINNSQQFPKELIEFAEKFYNALEKYGDVNKRKATISKKNLNDLKLMISSDGFSLDDIQEMAAYYFNVGRCRVEAPFVIQSLSSFRKKANSLRAAIRNLPKKQQDGH